MFLTIALVSGCATKIGPDSASDGAETGSSAADASTAMDTTTTMTTGSDKETLGSSHICFPGDPSPCPTFCYEHNVPVCPEQCAREALIPLSGPECQANEEQEISQCVENINGVCMETEPGLVVCDGQGNPFLSTGECTYFSECEVPASCSCSVYALASQCAADARCKVCEGPYACIDQDTPCEPAP